MDDVSDSPPATAGPAVRTASPSDLAALGAIYDEQVRTSVATFDVEPRPAQAWTAMLAREGAGLHLLVAEADGEVLGYASSSTYRPRPAYDRTRETSVYLAPGARGRGVGRLLYAALLARLRADGVHVALAVIALPNDASRALHRGCGYEPVGVLPEVGLKFDRWVDTELWARRLEPDPPRVR